MKTRLALVFLILLLGATNLQAGVVTKNITYQHDGVQLEGYMAYDDSVKGKVPAVLIVHEWWGLNDYARKRAEQLAAMGYVAFALDMYGKGKVTQHPKQAGEWMRQVNSNVSLWKQRALAGLQVLKNEPRTDIGRIAAIGYCFGGATVQQLAYSGAEVEGIVSFHGSLLPPTPDQVKKVKAKFLICHGAADPFVKAETLQNYIATMHKTDLDWQMIMYGGAKHSFTNPDADKAGMAALKYSKSADQRSWSHMKQFFDEIF
ncbi:MAG: dienelactone hydrolase family protein [Desulfobacteraceae bacterium]|jgi:dienelactone hydrolase